MPTHLEIEGRTYYAFEEPDFVGPLEQKPPKSTPEALATVERYNGGEFEARFWRRQFGIARTRRQAQFDWLFGVLMPAVCFFFDPFVFRGWESERGFLDAYQTFAYLLSGVAIMGLAAWLLWGEQLKWLMAPLSGVFVAAAVVSGIIGIVLFPFSLIGSLFLVGVLGFTPLFTSIIFLRNAHRAMQSAIGSDEARTLGYIAMLSGGAAVVIPWLVNILMASFDREGFDILW